jgi:hypothetical protein
LKKLYIIAFFCILAASRLHAQGQAKNDYQVDSIYFHLYTDSLKKGVHNYINVDGKTNNGRWLPLTAKELTFRCTAGKFEGNSLLIDSSFKEEKVTVKATLKSNPQVWREVTIYMKTRDTVERLRTVEEILNTPAPADRRRNRRNG